MPRWSAPRSTRPLIATAVVAALVALACSPAGSIRDSADDTTAVRRSQQVTDSAETQAEPGTPPTSTPAGPPESVDAIRVARNGSWVDTSCPMSPADSFWHARVDSLPTLDPNGGGLRQFPGAGGQDDPLRLRPGLRSASSKTITWSDASDPQMWVRLEGNWQSNSEYTAVEKLQVGPLTWASAGLLRHRVPEEVLIELSSTDDHALFVDTDTCTLVEYVGWSRMPGTTSGRKATVNDLGTNERRLSVREGWLTAPTNAIGTGVIDSPRIDLDTPLIGFERDLVEQARTGSTGASGGSAIPTGPGVVRVEEVFATPAPYDQTVDPAERIDHAITASLPSQHITGMPDEVNAWTPAPFSWPATTSDGCGGTTCRNGTAGSDHHVPMGSRLRLSAERCEEAWSEPQAQRIVEAMCTYGVVVTDSSDGFSIATERAHEGGTTKWRREADRQLADLTLRDFELVDSASRAQVDPQALWTEAKVWADRRYGLESGLPTGWYAGHFWNSVLECDRVAGRCADAGLARADTAVNGSRWFGVD